MRTPFSAQFFPLHGYMDPSGSKADAGSPRKSTSVATMADGGGVDVRRMAARSGGSTSRLAVWVVYLEAHGRF